MSDTTEMGLIPQGGVLDTDTGEVFPSIGEAPSLTLLRILGRVELETQRALDQLHSARAAIGAELTERMDKAGEWTIRAPGVQVTVPSPAAGTEGWDAELLDQILDGLIADGVITKDAKLRAVEQQVTLKVNKNGVKALQKIPAVRDAISRARLEQAAPARRVKVQVDPRGL